jgi:hypothetical protein
LNEVSKDFASEIELIGGSISSDVEEAYLHFTKESLAISDSSFKNSESKINNELGKDLFHANVSFDWKVAKKDFAPEVDSVSMKDTHVEFLPISDSGSKKFEQLGKDTIDTEKINSGYNVNFENLNHVSKEDFDAELVLTSNPVLQTEYSNEDVSPIGDPSNSMVDELDKEETLSYESPLSEDFKFALESIVDSPEYEQLKFYFQRKAALEYEKSENQISSET